MWWHLGKLPQVGNEARVAGLCQVHEGSFVSPCVYEGFRAASRARANLSKPDLSPEKARSLRMKALFWGE